MIVKKQEETMQIKIIFIIRHDIEEDFRSVIGNRIEAVCDSLQCST